MSQLCINLFGSPYVELNHQPVEIRLRKGLALLAFLAVEGERQSRDHLATLLWPGYSQQDARANLRRTLSALNQTLPGDWLLATRQAIALNPEASIRVDVLRLRSLVEETESLPAFVEAADLVRGPFMAGFSLEDAPDFDQWQSQETQYWSRQAGQLLERLARYHIESRSWAEGVPFAQRWVVLDPLNEEAHRLLMRLYASSGNRNAALAQYQECDRILRAELAVTPENATTELHESIRLGNLDAPSRHAAPPIPPPAQLKSPSGLNPAAKSLSRPQQTTPFLGRETELDQLRTSLLHEEGCRLVTLLGPGGSGKTRLAQAAGEQLAPHFDDGIIFVSLAGLESAARLESAVASALGFTFYSGDSSRAQLCHYLADKSILLILDNYEHLLDGADLPPALVASAPRLKILITSRERLGVQEEWLLEVNGLPYPQSVGGSHGESLEVLEAYAAVALFVERARRSQAGFALTAEHAPHVLRICQLTAGMPLALELAATWARLMTPREIVYQIGADLDFLQSNLRDLPARHRSLRAVFDHSWQLLSAEEQSVFARLSVFRGGFRADAAAEVAAASLPLLLSLADKSLISRDDDGRFAIHELMRQFGVEKLNTDPSSVAQAKRCFENYFVHFLARRYMPIRSQHQAKTLDEIQAETSNIRKAWPFVDGDLDQATLWNAAGCLIFYIELRGTWEEFQDDFQQLADLLQQQRRATVNEKESAEIALRQITASLNQSLIDLRLGRRKQVRNNLRMAEQLLIGLEGLASESRPLGYESLAGYRAWYLINCALLAVTEGEYAAAYGSLEEALDLFTQMQLPWEMGVVLRLMGHADRALGRYTEAEKHLYRSMDLLTTSGDKFQLAGVYGAMGYLYLLQGKGDTISVLQKAVALFRETGGLAQYSQTLRRLGEAEKVAGHLQRAKDHYIESLQMAQAYGHSSSIASSLRYLADLAVVETHYSEAINLAVRSKKIYSQLDNQMGVIRCQLLLARAYRNMGKVEQAQIVLSAAQIQATSLELCWLSAEIYQERFHLLWHVGKHEEARQELREALRAVNQIRAIPLLLNILTDCVPVLVQIGQVAQAASLIQSVFAHPATSHSARNRARQLYDHMSMPVLVEKPVSDEMLFGVAHELLGQLL